MTGGTEKQVLDAIEDLHVDIEMIDKHGHAGKPKWEAYRQRCEQQVAELQSELINGTRSSQRRVLDLLIQGKL